MITKKRIGKTGNLKNNIHINIVNGADGPEKVVLTFKHYGKFVDMGVGKGQKLGDVKGNQELAKAIGVKGRKAKKWFSKTFYPEVNTLENLLIKHYGQSAENIIKQLIPGQIQINL